MSMLENVVLYGWPSISAEMKVWSMHDADTQGTVEGRDEAKEQKKTFMFKFSLICLSSVSVKMV